MHKLLAKQLAQSREEDGRLDVDRLLRLVSSAYDDDERDRLRNARANRLMGQEIAQAHQRLESLVQDLQVQNERFHVALENMGRGLCMFDAAGLLIVHNQVFVELFGLHDQLVLRQPIAAVAAHCERSIVSTSTPSPGLLGEGDTPSLSVLIGQRRRASLQIDCNDGRTIVVSHEPLPDGGCVQLYVDVTAMRLADARLARMASHDALTDLPNRVLLRERLDAALLRREDGRCITLMSLDLDRFKLVNDSLGHPAGDALLQQVAQRLREHLRASDTIARLGGDEFALLMEHAVDTPLPTNLAGRILAAVEAPYDLDGQVANIGVSIGIAQVAEPGVDAVSMIKRADLALYHAKSAGRGQFAHFEPNMDAEAQKRRTLEIALRQALERNEFELHYQPLMHVERQQVSGFEALLRWRHPERGLVSPADFIPLAEELGLIVPIGAWVLRRACEAAAKWPGELRMAVNVSVRQFAQGGALVDTVTDALRSSGLQADRLELEITESVLMENNDATLDTLHRLRRLGVHIVMDDFGIGYSSLAYLRSFPFDKVKIDRSFTKEVAHKADAVAIIRAVSGLCSSLGIESTAEGVENDDQLRLVTQQDCTEVQGYLFSRPVPEADVPAVLDRLAQATHPHAA